MASTTPRIFWACCSVQGGWKTSRCVGSAVFGLREPSSRASHSLRSKVMAEMRAAFSA